MRPTRGRKDVDVQVEMGEPVPHLPTGRQAAGIGACASASASLHGSARQSVPGSSVMPPSRPAGGRRRSST